MQALAGHLLGVPRPARGRQGSQTAHAPVGVVTPRGWASNHERPNRLPRIRRHFHDHRRQAQKRSRHGVSRCGWPGRGGGPVQLGLTRAGAGGGARRGRAVRRARAGSGVTHLVRAHHEAQPGAGGGLRHRALRGTGFALKTPTPPAPPSRQGDGAASFLSPRIGRVGYIDAMTLFRTSLIFVDSSPSVTTTAIVITPRTTAYSAMVWPASSCSFCRNSVMVSSWGQWSNTLLSTQRHV